MSFVENFHLNLLGRDQAITPVRYCLSDRHRALYTGFTGLGVRGAANESLDAELMLGTLVLALSQTYGSSGFQPVVLITPRAKVKWVLSQIRETAEHIFRSRKGDLVGVGILREAFQKLQVSDQPLKLTAEPAHWVAFGFGADDALLPAWAKNGIR